MQEGTRLFGTLPFLLYTVLQVALFVFRISLFHSDRLSGHRLHIFHRVPAFLPVSLRFSDVSGHNPVVVLSIVFYLDIPLLMACCLLHLMVLWYQQRTSNGTTLMAVCVEFKNCANLNWDFIYSKGFNNCYILLSNISQALENTKFIAGELSLIVSLVLYCPMSIYELW